MRSKMAREAVFSIFVSLSVLGMQPVMAARQLAGNTLPDPQATPAYALDRRLVLW